MCPEICLPHANRCRRPSYRPSSNTLLSQKSAKRGGRPHSLKFAWYAFCSFYLFCCKYASALLLILSNTLLNTAISSCEMPASACFANSFGMAMPSVRIGCASAVKCSSICFLLVALCCRTTNPRCSSCFREVDTWDLVYLQIRTKLAAVLHSGLLCKNIRMSHSICVNSYLLQMVRISDS